MKSLIIISFLSLLATSCGNDKRSGNDAGNTKDEGPYQYRNDSNDVDSKGNQ